MSFQEKKLTELKQISEKRAKLFSKLNINNLQDLLFFFPRDYQDLSEIKPLHLVVNGEMATIRAKIIKAPTLQRRGKLSWIKTVLTDNVTMISAIWFNQPWLIQKIKVGYTFYFYGKIQNQGRSFSIQNPQILDDTEYEQNKIQAIYPLTNGLNQKLIRFAVKQTLDLYDQSLYDPIPDEIRREAKLSTLEYALEKIHIPDDKQECLIARERLAFEELFLVRTALYLLKWKRTESEKAYPLIAADDIENKKILKKMNHLRDDLPFELTKAQMLAINDLLNDLKKSKPMNRLLQGDVGSGKTLVAAFAIAYAIFCQGQCIFMAPTSILAKQHYQTLTSFFSDQNFEIRLLTGQTKAKERKEILENAYSGKIDLIIGTHAVLEKDLKMKNLVLTITDEQHRFGVEQRAAIANVNENDYTPHRLVISATPIPRTLGLILYGDLDLTLMRELPKGRKKIQTYTANSKDEKRIYKLIRQAVSRDEQVYVVCPLIEDSEELDVDSVESVYKKFSEKIFPDLKVGLMHGGLKADLKNSIMQDFLDNKINILVSTTVIEVGVDNPRASFMLIRNAERFGLAQLHQLRGRIGRSDLESICILLSDTEDEIALTRLKTLCKNDDGFALAEEDLRLRGPGDFFGTKQHGLPQFKLINLYEDQNVIQSVDYYFSQIITKDPALKNQENRNITKAIQQRYPELLSGIIL